MDFNFNMPTRIISGKDCIIKNSKLFLGFGKKALIVTGKNSSKENGSLDDVINTLKKENINYTLFDKVEPNPSLETVIKGSEIGKKENVDFTIGIGGGSPLDAAKAISILTNNMIDETDFFSGIYNNKILPNVAVPTTAGTGSEVTQYAIITDKISKTKRNLFTKDNFPKIAFLDGKYMKEMNIEITFNTAIDALTHSLEGYLSKRANIFTDFIALESIKIIGKLINKIIENKLEKFDRNMLLFSSTLAGVVIAQTGTTALHALGYSLTYYRKIDHGKANGILLSEYLKFVNLKQQVKVKEILGCLNLTSISELEVLIKKMYLDTYNLNLDEIEVFSKSAIKQGSIKNTIPEPNINDLREIYKKI